MAELVQVQIADVFKPLVVPSRYKGAWGGRGSGKSHHFAGWMVLEHYANPGFRSICLREVQKTLKESAKRLIEEKIQAFGLGKHFDVKEAEIRSRGGGLIIFQGMQDHNAESVKSLEGFNRAWIEEAQSLSERSLYLLRPTIRAEKSEIWASWNPTRKRDAIDVLLRQNKPEDAIVVRANWRDNPWWTDVLEKERQIEQKIYPERYPHTYEGEYATAFSGAYFAKCLLEAKTDGRIGKIAKDPILPIRAFIDIGGAGAAADAMAIWIAQFVGQSVFLLDYIEGIGQPLGYYANELRSRGWDKAQLFLPHDGIVANNVTGKRYEDHWRDAGFIATSIPNQGRGAAALRIEAARRIFPKCWFEESKTEGGRDALGFYHEKRDEQRDIGQGPEHDWSSHAADAFGLMAICYEDPARARNFNRKLLSPRMEFA